LGVKVKGGMWCPSCERPVAGQKSTQKVAKLSGALTGYIPTPGDYHCPHCGSRVRPLPAKGPNWELVIPIAIGVVILVIGSIAWGIHAVIGGSSHSGTVPSLHGDSLDAAKRELKNLGIKADYNHDQGVFGIVDESNWVVCGEDPPPGSTASKVWLDVRHFSC
jgi:hypothetical protein